MDQIEKDLLTFSNEDLHILYNYYNVDNTSSLAFKIRTEKLGSNDFVLGTKSQIWFNHKTIINLIFFTS